MAEQLTFADGRTRTRRDHPKYLALISSVALLHQHQRPRRTIVHAGREVTYVEATSFDVEAANRLAAGVLGQSLDELPPQTRRLLELLDATVTRIAAHDQIDRSIVRFTRRQLREELGWGDTQLKVHLARLVDLELVAAHRVEHGVLLYELAWNGAAGRDGGRFIVGVTDPSQPSLPLDNYGYDTSRSGQDPVRSGAGRGLVGPVSAGGRTHQNGSQPNTSNGFMPTAGVDGLKPTDPAKTEPAVIHTPMNGLRADDPHRVGGNPQRSGGAAVEERATRRVRVVV